MAVPGNAIHTPGVSGRPHQLSVDLPTFQNPARHLARRCRERLGMRQGTPKGGSSEWRICQSPFRRWQRGRDRPWPACRRWLPPGGQVLWLCGCRAPMSTMRLVMGFRRVAAGAMTAMAVPRQRNTCKNTGRKESFQRPNPSTGERAVMTRFPRTSNGKRLPFGWAGLHHWRKN